MHVKMMVGNHLLITEVGASKDINDRLMVNFEAVMTNLRLSTNSATIAFDFGHLGKAYFRVEII